MTKEEVFKSTLKYFKNDELATNVWINKYCLKNKNRELLELNPDDMHHRIAKEISRIENNYQNPIPENEIYELLKDFKYIVPQGSPMMGIGNDYQIVSISNCFYLHHKGDSYGSIMDIDEKLAHIFKHRGGCGIDLSQIRPYDSKINNAALTSTGLVPFAERYSNTTREVAEEGRRGALMISLSIKHPDAERFIDAKLEQGKVTGANISVKITDDFIEAVKNDSDYFQCFPIDLNVLDHTGFHEMYHNKSFEYNKIYDLQYKNDNEYKGCYVKVIKAKELWNKIIKNAKNSAEPGVLFWDNFKRESPSDGYEGFELQGVNPCAELSLSDLESCRLLVLNLYSYVIDPFTKNAKFDYDLFKKHTQISQRFMDDIVDLEIEKINKIIEKVESDKEEDQIKAKELGLWKEINRKGIEGRRTGLGITAEGDMLAALGIKYGTEEANNFTEEVHKILAIETYKSSVQLAKERGAFPIWNYEKEKDNPFINRIIGHFVINEFKDSVENIDGKWVDDYLTYGRRNIACLTIAPTGSVSIMTQTSSGIEPVFEIVYKRRRKVEKGSIKNPFIDEVGDHWEEYKIFHPKFIEWYLKRAPELQTYENTIKFLSHLQNIEGLIQESPYYKATANEIDYLKKVEMQGRIQKWVDHSISVTHNLPKGISEEEVSKIYMKAYDCGCKGCTVYVDGSRSGVLIKDEKNKFDRPESLPCDIYVVKVNGKDWVVLIGLNNNNPYEIFAFKQSNLQITHDLPNAQLIKRKVKNKNYYDLIANSHFRLNDIASFFELGEEQSLTRQISLNLRYGIVPIDEIIDQLEKATGSVVELSKALLRVLKKYVKDNSSTGGVCPECGEKLVYNSGCASCASCGYSKC